MKIKIALVQAMILILATGILVGGCQMRGGQESVQAASITIGSQGDTVRKIQTKLKNWGYFDGAVDGIYGNETKQAVIAFQKKNGLTPDGVAGTQTLEAMGIFENSSSSSSSSTSSSSGAQGYSQSDRNLLARVINGEARGEPFLGQVAVGAVILNRVEHPSFPNTIAGVVYQPLAFTAVADGQIDADMYESCYRAADMALSGVDPTGGAIYYYNPQTATSEWIFSRPTIKTIGKHVFAK